MKELFEELRKEMSSISEGKVDRKYLESEEWFDLVIKAIEAAVRTRHKEKINLYARVLRGAVTIQNRQEFSPEEYVAVLTELTLREIEVAQVIYGQQCDVPMQPNENELQWAWRTGWKQLPPSCPSVPEEDIPFTLLRLQKSGLIREITGTYFDYTGGVYVITESFRKLMRYIENKINYCSHPFMKI